MHEYDQVANSIVPLFRGAVYINSCEPSLRQSYHLDLASVEPQELKSVYPLEFVTSWHTVICRISRAQSIPLLPLSIAVLLNSPCVISGQLYDA